MKAVVGLDDAARVAVEVWVRWTTVRKDAAELLEVNEVRSPEQVPLGADLLARARRRAVEVVEPERSVVKERDDVSDPGGRRTVECPRFHCPSDNANYQWR